MFLIFCLITTIYMTIKTTTYIHNHPLKIFSLIQHSKLKIHNHLFINHFLRHFSPQLLSFPCALRHEPCASLSSPICQLITAISLSFSKVCFPILTILLIISPICASSLKTILLKFI